MESLLPSILAALTKDGNIAVLVLLLVCVGLGWLHIIWRREEREDRKQLYSVVEAQTQAVESLRTTITLLLGKQA